MAIPEKSKIIFPNRACGTSGKRSVQELAKIERREKMHNRIQGVLSKIEFPLGQDEYAVSRAIHCLLIEGWEFVGITKTHLTLIRRWEVDLEQKPMFAEDQRVNK